MVAERINSREKMVRATGRPEPKLLAIPLADGMRIEDRPVLRGSDRRLPHETKVPYQFIVQSLIITVHTPSFMMPNSDSSLNGSNSIWLLDDDASMLKALSRLLRSAGFSVEKFNHPTAFLSRLEQARCQVAVVDVWMPDMNGLEVQARIRRNSPETRIIFMTGRDDPSVRQTALDAGAFAFLAKPFDDGVLVELIQKAVAD